MDNITINEQIAPETHTVETEEVVKGENQGEISLGKFKDVQSLLDAYNSLQAEFTKRCQRLKELEGLSNFDKTENPVPKEVEEGEPTAKKGITDEEKKAILQDYLKNVLGSKQTAVVIDGAGVGVRTPAEKPKSISEAGMLAKEILQ